ncbi:MAG TPA: GNAT family N-acetyltransferase [archaeon]|nr:GNAT family N-acetyltransferase [archaeon]
MKFKILPAKKSDIPAIAELFRVEFGKAPYNEKWGKKGSLKKIRMHYANYKILISKVSRELAGFIVFYNDFWFGKKIVFINDIVVSEKYQNSGIGTELMNRAEHAFRKKGVRESYLIALEGKHAFDFYHKAHYTKTKWVLMKKKL